MIFSSHGIIGSQITQFVGLLDQYSGAAAAYSLRKLRSAYTGSAIRVRRASDNTEQDIGFVDGQLDTSTLTSFCSGTDGFVKTWYDQSGNANDATQATLANQPQIVSSGSVILENGKPSVQFDGSNDQLHANYSGISGEDIPFSIFSVVKTNTGTGNQSFVAISNSANLAPITSLLLLSSNYGYFFRDDTNTALSNTSTQLHDQINLNLICEGTTSSVYYNNTKIINSGNTNLGVITRDRINLGVFRELTPSNFLNGEIQEVIIYASDKTLDNSGISTNINDFYSIY